MVKAYNFNGLWTSIYIEFQSPRIFPLNLFPLPKETEIADLDKDLTEAINAYDSLKKKVAKMAKWANRCPCYPLNDYWPWMFIQKSWFKNEAILNVPFWPGKST